MDRLRVALLDASHGNPHTPRNFRRELDCDLAEYDVTAGELPAADADLDAAVLTGSRASAYWEEAWIDATREYVAGLVDDGIPVLGVCFGHQLLADALGGRVADMGEYEIGYREIERRGDSTLLAGVDDRFTAFTTHSDEVVEVPPGASVLAKNDYSIHGFRKDRAFGVQFHPEYDPETARSVTSEKDELDETRKRAVLEGITAANHDAAGEARTVFENFTAFAAAVRDRRAPA